MPSEQPQGLTQTNRKESIMAVMGAPTKYNDKIIEKTIDYIENFAKYGEQIVPSIAGLCNILNVGKSTVYDWALQEDKKDFSDTLERLQQKQEILLLTGGLSNTYNSTITKLMLCNHGYSDKSEVDQRGEQELNINIHSV